MFLGNQASFLGPTKEDDVFVYTVDYHNNIFAGEDYITFFPILIMRLTSDDVDFPRARFEALSDDNKKIVNDSNYQPSKLVYYLSKSSLISDFNWGDNKSIFLSVPDSIAEQIVSLVELMIKPSHDDNYIDVAELLITPASEVEELFYDNSKVPLSIRLQKTIIDSKIIAKLPAPLRKSLFPLFMKEIEKNGIKKATDKLATFFFINELVGIFIQDRKNNLSVFDIYKPTITFPNGTYDTNTYTHKVDNNYDTLLKTMHSKYNKLDFSIHEHTIGLSALIFDGDMIHDAIRRKLYRFTSEHLIIQENNSNALGHLRSNDFVNMSRNIDYNKKDNKLSHNGVLSYPDNNIFASLETMFKYFFDTDNFHYNLTVDDMLHNTDSSFHQNEYQKCILLSIQIYQVLNKIEDNIDGVEKNNFSEFFAKETLPISTQIVVEMNKGRKIDEMITPTEVGLTGFLLAQIQWVASDKNNNTLNKKELEKSVRMIFNTNKSFYDNLSLYDIIIIAHTYVSHNHKIPLPMVKNMVISKK